MDMNTIDKIKDTKLYGIPKIAEILDVHPITAREKVLNLVPEKPEYRINSNTGGTINVRKVTGYAIKRFILWIEK